MTAKTSFGLLASVCSVEGVTEEGDECKIPVRRQFIATPQARTTAESLLVILTINNISSAFGTSLFT